MTAPTITWQQIDAIAERLMGSNARNYYGDRPCLPTGALLEVCRRISNKKTNP